MDFDFLGIKMEFSPMKLGSLRNIELTETLFQEL